MNGVYLEIKNINIIFAKTLVAFTNFVAGPRSAVGRALDSSVRGPGFDTRSGYMFLFLLLLIQEG